MAARRLHHLIYMTIVNCCLFVVTCAVAVWLNRWYSVSTNEDFSRQGGVTATFGLFSGAKTVKAMSQVEVRYNLKIVCQGMTGCMFSCGINSKKRRQDLDTLLKGMEAYDYLWCQNIDFDLPTRTNLLEGNLKLHNTTAAAKADEEEGKSRVFLNFGLYLATIGFIGLGVMFSILSGIMALYNTYRTPIQPMLSVYGLYFWNGIAGGLLFLAMLMWLIEFLTSLQKGAPVSEVISGYYTSDGNGSLGISYWILILPIVFSLANIGILMYRKWKIVDMQKENVRVMKGERDGQNADTILF